MLASEQDRADVARRRVRWQRFQGQINPQRLVFIDETPDQVRGGPRTKTNMAPLRGWGKRGDRVKAKAPFGHWNTMTPDHPCFRRGRLRGKLFLAALRHDRIDAPWVFDGPINAEIFRTYVENVLVPTLNPGDIVILDNLGSHKAPAVKAAIRAAGARLWFLPPPDRVRGRLYSPDPGSPLLSQGQAPGQAPGSPLLSQGQAPGQALNPIKQVFAKLKHLLRKAATRSKETLWRKIGDLLSQFTPNECGNYLVNSYQNSVTVTLTGIPNSVEV